MGKAAFPYQKRKEGPGIKVKVGAMLFWGIDLGKIYFEDQRPSLCHFNFEDVSLQDPKHLKRKAKGGEDPEPHEREYHPDADARNLGSCHFIDSFQIETSSRHAIHCHMSNCVIPKLKGQQMGNLSRWDRMP
jgi:hypothetical protein